MYSILTIEMAINYWCVVAPSPDQVCLTPNVRVLADVYGRMISERATEVARSNLTVAQSRAVTAAVEQLSAPIEIA